MNSFVTLGVHAPVVQALADLGFAAPTPVQEEVIPVLLRQEGDWICLAQTGTGKTAAFGIPLVQQVDQAKNRTQSLILCPTRELCLQVARDLGAFAAHLAGVKILAVYGGARIDTQINALRGGVHLIVATPGRLHDLLRRGAADLSGLRNVVLDEADEMLNMGFQEEIGAILGHAPAARTTLLFSATMSREVGAIAARYMTDAREIQVGRRNSGAENVRHLYCMVRAQDRFPALKRFVDLHPDIYGIIFCRTRQETQEVADRLIQDGYRADALHGDLAQSQRDLVMAKFRKRHLQLLVATDVAARGVDVNDLSHVINYNLPDDIAVYTHRSGRTGRAGKGGVAVSIIHQREGWRIRAIEKSIGRSFEYARVPSGRAICERQIMHRIGDLCDQTADFAGIEAILPSVAEKLAHLDREELIRRFVVREARGFLEYYRDAPDLDVRGLESERGQKKRNEPGRGKERATEQYTRFQVNVGREDGVLPQRLIAIINSGAGRRRIAIGRIELQRNLSFIEADSRFADNVLHSFQRLMINGKKVNIEIAAAGKGEHAAGRREASVRKGAKWAAGSKPRAWRNQGG